MAEKLNATFFAFRKRERGGVLLQLSLAFLIGAMVLIAGFFALFWTSIVDFVGTAASGDASAANAPELPYIFTMIGALLLWLLPFYLLCAAYEAGSLRWMIHGETAGFMGLSLGAPTWRVWSGYWMWFLLTIAFSFVMGFVMTILMGAMAVSSGGDALATMSALPVFYFIQYLIMIYFSVRFAPAAATSVARQRFSFFEAWTVTKGRFWALLGSFVLLYLLYFIAGLVLAAVWFGVVLGASLPDASIFTDNARLTEFVTGMLNTYLQALSQPRTWIALGLLQIASLILGMLLYIGMFGVNARAAQAALEEEKITPAA